MLELQIPNNLSLDLFKKIYSFEALVKSQNKNKKSTNQAKIANF